MQVSDGMLAAAAEALARMPSVQDLRDGALLPHISRLREAAVEVPGVCGRDGGSVGSMSCVPGIGNSIIINHQITADGAAAAAAAALLRMLVCCWLAASCFLLPASCFLLPAACCLLPASCILPPAP